MVHTLKALHGENPAEDVEVFIEVKTGPLEGDWTVVPGNTNIGGEFPGEFSTDQEPHEGAEFWLAKIKDPQGLWELAPLQENPVQVDYPEQGVEMNVVPLP